jgi:hypothetical protein
MALRMRVRRRKEKGEVRMRWENAGERRKELLKED